MVRGRQILEWFQFKIFARSKPVARARVHWCFFVVLTGFLSSETVLYLWHTLSFVNRNCIDWRERGGKKKARSIYFCKSLLKNYKNVRFRGREIFSLLLVLDITNQREGQPFLLLPSCYWRCLKAEDPLCVWINEQESW